MTATRSQTQTSFNKYTDFFDSKVDTKPRLWSAVYCYMLRKSRRKGKDNEKVFLKVSRDTLNAVVKQKTEHCRYRDTGEDSCLPNVQGNPGLIFKGRMYLPEGYNSYVLLE